MNIEFHTLSVVNFRNISELEINFSPGSLTLIRGRNGSGKSSIFNAIYTCLYNRQVNGRPASKAIKNGTKYCTLKLKFSVNNVEYILERKIGSGSFVKLTKEDQEITGNKVKNIVEEILPPDILKLCMLKTINIKEIISKLTDVTNFVQKISERIKEVEKDRVVVEQEISSLKNSKDTIQSQISQLERMYSETLQNLENLEKTLITLDFNEQEVIEKQKLVQEFQVTFREQAKNLESEIRNKIQLEIDTPQQEIKTLLVKIDQQLNSLLHKLDSEIQQKKSQSMFEIQKINSEISNYQKEINHIQKLLETKLCYTCNRPITQNDIFKFTSKMEDLKLKIQELNNKKKLIEEQLNQDINQKEIKKQEYINRASNKKQELESQLSELENKREKYIIALENLDYEKRKLFDKLLTKFKLSQDDLTIDFNSLFRKVNLYNEQRAKIETYHKNLEHLTKEINKLKNELKSLDYETKILDLKNKINELDKEQKILETWNNTRLLKKLLVKKVNSSINKLLKHKYGKQLLEVQMEVTKTDDLEIFVRNINGDLVTIEEVSTGENVIANLSLYSAIRELLSLEYNIQCLFLDEFLDSLDEGNINKVLYFLKDQCKKGMTIMVISHREDVQDELYDFVIDMNQI